METGGTWMEINCGMINDFLVLDIDSLGIDEKRQLLDLFEKIKSTEFPSIFDQLKKGFTPRRELDTALLRIMSYSKKESNQLLEYLYPALANEIEKLKTLMEG
jgi:hypothetical protein